jgi:PKD repeat protein
VVLRNGIIPESCFPYQANDRIPCSEKCENWRDYLIPLSDTGYWMFEGKKEEIEEMKTWILAYGPITSAMHVDDDFKSWGATHHHPEDVFTSNKGLVANDHLVAIVGWKDNPTMKKGGYWICKNSWGMDFGYDGFFNIEYNSLGIDSGETSWVDYTPDDYNWPPVPMLASLYKGRAGEEILFDASESADPEGSIVRYDWDFGDGKSGSGMSPTHTYESQGVYTVTLAVYDNEGQLGITTSLARIQDDTNNKPSTPIIDGPSSGRKNVACLYTISASDPDGNDILFYVDWGDDQTTGWIESSSEDQVYLTHKWSTIGTYEIAVKAMDEFGAESDWGTHAVHIPKTRLMDQLYRFFNNHVNLFSFLSYIIDHTHE